MEMFCAVPVIVDEDDAKRRGWFTLNQIGGC
jgi:hypothetical protein